MYEGPAQSNSVSSGGSSKNGEVSTTLGDSGYGLASDMEALNADATLASSYLLELASNNNLEGFQQAVEEGKTKLDVVGSWYCRQNGTSQMVVEQRTSIMVAALYGSVDVLMYILKSYASFGGDVNQKCGTDESSALHCAAGGGSVLAVVTVNLLLDNGANLNVLDAQGRRPADVIAKFPRHAHVKAELERVLKSVKPMRTMSLDVPEGLDSGVFAFTEDGEFGCNGVGLDAAGDGGVLQIAFSSASSLSVSPGGGCQSPVSSMSPSSSPKSFDTAAVKFLREAVEKVKEYPVDPSIPDVKNSMYTSDEFRMFSFKVRPCSRAYSHDWTECPFVHPGENARRRDPRRYHYSCVPCADFRKGACSHGDACEYAHGVFECWLHPAQYRTRLCKDGTGCTRRVCFFAHTTEELRHLYVSTGSALPSPRTTTSLYMASMSPLLAPSSPSSVLLMSPFSPSNPAHQQGSLVTPPMSPSSPSANSLPSAWSQSNVPALHLPGVGLHSSRLRAALSARDIFSEDLERAPDFGRHSMSEFTALSSQVLSTQARLNAAVAASACGTTSSLARKYRSLGLTVTPTNLEDLFASNMMSMVHDSALLSPIKSPMQLHKSSILQTQLHNEVQAQMQLQLNQAALDSQLQGSPLLCSPLQTPSFSLGRLSSLGGSDVDVDRQGSIGAYKFPSAVAAQSEAFVQCNNRTQCLQDLGGGLSWSGWGSPTGKPEWGVHGDDLSKFRKLASFGFKKNDEPDFLRVQKLVKEGSPEANAAATVSSEDGSVSVPTKDPADHFVSGSWIENIHLDQIAAGSV